jgi:plastocyanin
MSMRTVRSAGLVALLALIVALLGTGALTGTPKADAATGVTIGDRYFSPAVIFVPVGTTVTWTNTGYEVHTTTSNTNIWDSGNLDRGETFSYTFNQAGTFSYHCKLHPEMRGTVNVGTSGTTYPNPTYTYPNPGYITTAPYTATLPYTGSACTTAGFRFDVDSRVYYQYSYPCNGYLFFYNGCNCYQPFSNFYNNRFFYGGGFQTYGSSPGFVTSPGY